MPNWDDFDTIFYFNRNFTYDGRLVDQITANRRALQDQLFIDRLLELLEVRPGVCSFAQGKEEADHSIPVAKVYPPTSNASLRGLVDRILFSPFPSHQKQALIYYILKDCRVSSDAVTDFARRCHLPEKYRMFIEGLWHLDRLDLRVFFRIPANPWNSSLTTFLSLHSEPSNISPNQRLFQRFPMKFSTCSPSHAFPSKMTALYWHTTSPYPHR